MKDAYWYVKSSGGKVPPDEVFPLSPLLVNGLRPGHGLVYADWLPGEQLGHVYAFGLVREVNQELGTANVAWREVNVHLKPNPSGRSHWANKTAFRFADSVKVRYMLADLFAEAFPDMADIGLGRWIRDPNTPRTERPSFASDGPGYVYVVKSPYGYKIGKTVNLKDRLRLFAVKLPFAIEITHYAHFDRYSEAERTFHLKFSGQRLEGEWFDLYEEDLEYIKSQGTPVDSGKI